MSGWEDALLVASNPLPAAQWRAALACSLASAHEVARSVVITCAPDALAQGAATTSDGAQAVLEAASDVVTVKLLTSNAVTLGAISLRVHSTEDASTVRLRLQDVCAIASHTLETALDLASSCGARAETVGSETHNVLAAESASRVLSAREKQVAALVCAGYSDLNIATQLGISEATVGTHLHKIYRKLRVHTRVELARKLGGL
jgi:DNA-binding CsgD family transcriptional regulator